MISDLLKKWAELEPDRCSFDRHSEAFKILDRSGDSYLVPIDGLYDDCQILGCVLDAIDHHSALYRLENDTAGRAYASIQGRDRNSATRSRAATSDRFQQASDDDRSIALLSAYVAWLEAVSAVKAT